MNVALTMMLLGLSVGASYAAGTPSFERAAMLADEGRYEDALAEYDALLSLHPDNVDYVFGRAQVLARQGRRDEALHALREASRLAPDYEAVWRLRHTLLLQSPEAAAEREAVAEIASRRFPGSDWWLREPEPEPSRWTLMAGAERSSLSNDQPGWEHEFVELRRAWPGIGNLYLRADRQSRFDSADYELTLRGDFEAGDDWFVALGAAAAPDSAFLAQRSYTVRASRGFADGLLAGLGYRRREFADTTVDSISPGLDWYFGSFRTALSLTWSRLDGGETSLGRSLAFNWYAGERHSFGLSASWGEEAESIGPNAVLETDVEGLSLNGRHGLSERVTLHWWAGLHEQGDFYRRRYVGVAVSVGL